MEAQPASQEAAKPAPAEKLFWACRIGWHEWRLIGPGDLCRCHFCPQEAVIGESH